MNGKRTYFFAAAMLGALMLSRCTLVDAACDAGDGSCDASIMAVLSNSFLPVTAAPLPVSGARLWLTGGFGVAHTNGRVFAWRDQSGNENHAVAPGGQGPALNPTSINGRDSLAFDGQVTNFTLANRFIYVTAAEGGMTIMAVVRSDDVDGTGLHFVIDFGFVANEGFGLQYSSDNGGTTEGGFYTPSDHGGSFQTFDVTATTADWVILTFRVEFGVEQRVYVGGSSVFSTSITLAELTTTTIREQTFRNSTLGGPVSIGMQSKFAQNGRNFRGDMAEIILFPAALSTADRETMECYLSTQYGITVPHACS